MISVVGDNLGTTVGQSNPVFTLNNSVFVLSLLLVEVGTGVVVRHSIGVGKRPGRDLDLTVVWRWSAVWWWWDSGGEGGHGADNNNKKSKLWTREKEG